MKLRLLIAVALAGCASGEAASTRQGGAVDVVAGASAAAKPDSGVSVQRAPQPPAEADPAPATPGPKRKPAPPPEPACAPRCSDRICGPDPVCGESCGSCRAGLRCSEGTCIAAERLRENGDTCSSDLECASVFCAESNVGELRCYGDQRSNETCGDVFDCRGGACVPMTPNGTLICSGGLSECVITLGLPGACADYVLGFCQALVLDCPNKVPDFDACYVDGCRSLARETNVGDCQVGLTRLRNGESPCR